MCLTPCNTQVAREWAQADVEVVFGEWTDGRPCRRRVVVIGNDGSIDYYVETLWNGTSTLAPAHGPRGVNP